MCLLVLCARFGRPDLLSGDAPLLGARTGGATKESNSGGRWLVDGLKPGLLLVPVLYVAREERRKQSKQKGLAGLAVFPRLISGKSESKWLVFTGALRP